jgi:general secretion pathway protein F
MKFSARAINNQHQIIELCIDADNEMDARAQVEREGHTLLRIHAERFSLAWVSTAGRTAHHRELLNGFNTELLALLQAGLSLIESLETLIEKEAYAPRLAMLTKLITAIRHGKRFSVALAEQPHFFPKLYIGIIKASEETSHLQNALSRYGAYTERGDALRRKIINAIIYPGILLLVGSVVVLFLMTYVVPRFSEVYKGSGRELPWLSQVLLSWGQFFSQNTKLMLVIVIASLVALLVLFLRSGTTPLVRLVRKIPMIQSKLHLMELSRLYLTLGMLLEGGIVITEALNIVGESQSDFTRPKVAKASTLILQGNAMSSAFDAHGLTTPISLRLIRTGEKSGQLGTMLAEAGKYHEAEISVWMERFSKAFEPCLMAFIGLMVGTIVVLLYMPIFDLAGSIQ